MSKISYKFVVTEVFLKRDAADGKRDLVTEASWELVGKHESGITAKRYGSEPLGNPAKHAVHEGMTPETVARWVEETFAPDLMGELKADIEARIMEQVGLAEYRVRAPWKVRSPVAGQEDVQPADSVLLNHSG